MMAHIKRVDGLLVIALLGFALVSGIIFSPVSDPKMIQILDRFSNILLAFVVIATLVPLLRASQHWGGEIGRNLQLIALGLVFFMFSIVPHVEWHVLGAPEPLGPSMFALSSAWWAGFFHILTIVSWVIIIYGFYNFWQLARPQTPEGEGVANE